MFSKIWMFEMNMKCLFTFWFIAPKISKHAKPIVTRVMITGSSSVNNLISVLFILSSWLNWEIFQFFWFSMEQMNWQKIFYSYNKNLLNKNLNLDTHAWIKYSKQSLNIYRTYTFTLSVLFRLNLLFTTSI